MDLGHEQLPDIHGLPKKLPILPSDAAPSHGRNSKEGVAAAIASVDVLIPRFSTAP